MACAICQTRRPRRFCPGVQGDICSVCCGTEREVTVSCPLECEYLQQARKRDKRPSLEGIEIPNRDLRVDEDWLRDHERLLAFMAGSLLRPALEIPGVVDQDIREALDAMIRTYRTLQSGVYYETRPENSRPPAAAGMGRIPPASTGGKNPRGWGLPRRATAKCSGCWFSSSTSSWTPTTAAPAGAPSWMRCAASMRPIPARRFRPNRR